MSVRRPLWVQRLAFVISELTDPAGAARLRMSRGALNEAGDGPSGRRAGLDDPASLSALTEGRAQHPRGLRGSAVGEGDHDLSGQTWPAGCLVSPSVSASADVVSLPGAPSPLLGARPRTSVPGLGRTRSLFFFGFVVLGLPLGVAAATLAGAVT